METLLNTSNFLGRDITQKNGQYNIKDDKYVFFIKREKLTVSLRIINYKA